MNGRIAFFDFDGTITTKDTLLEFLKFVRGRTGFYKGFLLNSPYLLAYKIKLITNQAAKEKVLRYFLGGMPVQQFEELCQNFSDNILPELIRPAAMEEIRTLKNQGYRLVLVSASPENWIRPWAGKTGFEVIATRLIAQENRIQGVIEGKNCHGNEKVNRIKEVIALDQYSDIRAYGDSGGDTAMLALAGVGKSFYKPFR